jgi:hypothetical protein
MTSLGARAWYAYHCLPRVRGEPPELKDFERTSGINNGVLAKLFSGKQNSFREETQATAVAKALKVSKGFLRDGEGDWPTPTGPVPQRKVTYRGGTKLEVPEYETVEPPSARQAPPSRTESEAQGDPAFDKAIATLILEHDWAKARAERVVYALPPVFNHSSVEMTAENIVRVVLAIDRELKERMTGRSPRRPKKAQ